MYNLVDSINYFNYSVSLLINLSNKLCIFFYKKNEVKIKY